MRRGDRFIRCRYPEALVAAFRALRAGNAVSRRPQLGQSGRLRETGRGTRRVAGRADVRREPNHALQSVGMFSGGRGRRTAGGSDGTAVANERLLSCEWVRSGGVPRDGASVAVSGLAATRSAGAWGP